MSRIKTIIKLFLLRNIYSIHVLHILSKGRLRPAILRYCGAKVGKNTRLGPFVYWDNHLELLEMGDNVAVSPQACFLFHKRDLKGFKYGSQYARMPYIHKSIVLKNNCCIGTRALILPGVTVGEGSFVAAGAVVTKDVPDWSIVAGIPAKVIRTYSPEFKI